MKYRYNFFLICQYQYQYVLITYREFFDENIPSTVYHCPKSYFWVFATSLHSTTRLSLSKGTETFFSLPNKEEIEWNICGAAWILWIASFRNCVVLNIIFFLCVSEYITHEYCENVANFTIHFIMYMYSIFWYIVTLQK